MFSYNLLRQSTQLFAVSAKPSGRVRARTKTSLREQKYDDSVRAVVHRVLLHMSAQGNFSSK